MDTLDVRGLSCPLPVLRVKQKLDKGASNFRIVGSAEVAFENVTKFLRAQGIDCKVVSHSAHEWEIEVGREGR